MFFWNSCFFYEPTDVGNLYLINKSALEEFPWEQPKMCQICEERLSCIQERSGSWKLRLCWRVNRGWKNGVTAVCDQRSWETGSGEREKKMYMYNIEKQYKWIYLWCRNRDTIVENKCMASKGERGRVREINESLKLFQ